MRTRAHRATLICFDGIDGSGKSTQVQLLLQRLRADGWDVAVVRSDGLPYLSRPVVNVAKRILKRSKAYRSEPAHKDPTPSTTSDPYADYLSSTNRMFKHGILRRAWTDVSLFEHAIEATLTVAPHMLRGKIVVCDRYLYKSVVNLAVLFGARSGYVAKLLRHPALRLVPQPSLYIVVDTPAETAYARKDDIPSIEYVRRRAPLYRAIAAADGAPVIDGTQPPEAMAENIWTLVQTVLPASSNADPVSTIAD